MKTLKYAIASIVWLSVCRVHFWEPGLLAASGEQRLPNTFFAYCIDTHDSKHRSLEQQAVMLKELGFAGVGHLWLDRVAERLRTLDAHGLKLVQLYLRVSLEPSKPAFDPRLGDVLPLLKGRDVILGVVVSGMKPADPAGEDRAVEIVRQIAAMAEPVGVRVALYPHVGDWVERVEDAIRVAKKVDRKNVGVMFNLCHWLKVDRSRDYRKLLEAARPYLMVVTINGADPDGTGWDRLIQPLDRGTFDLVGFLRTLRQLGYTGPIGLMAYGIPGDVREHLARSMAAWQKLSVEAAR